MNHAYDIVKKSRSSSRWTGSVFIRNLTDEFEEMHGDRRFADDGAVIGGVGRMDDLLLTVIAIEKGHDAKDRAARNFGAPHPEGYRKALRLMKQAEKFHRPVLTLIDTSGAYCGIGAEERGQGQAIAENIMEMMTLNTPVIAIIIGEGGSGGALALGVADRVMMLSSSVYSVISPEGCASILWKDAKYAARAAESLHLTAEDALRAGIIEEILEEDKKEDVFFTELREKLHQQFRELAENDRLPEERYERFRKF